MCQSGLLSSWIFPSTYTFISVPSGKSFSSDLDAPIFHPHIQHLKIWSSSRLKPLKLLQYRLWPCAKPRKVTLVYKLGPTVCSDALHSFVHSFTHFYCVVVSLKAKPEPRMLGVCLGGDLRRQKWRSGGSESEKKPVELYNWAGYCRGHLGLISRALWRTM